MGQSSFRPAELITTAAEPYQATAAVTIPNHSPSFTMTGGSSRFPMIKRRHVMLSTAKSMKSTRDVQKAATLMYSVKMYQHSRNRPVAFLACPVLTMVGTIR